MPHTVAEAARTVNESRPRETDLAGDEGAGVCLGARGALRRDDRRELSERVRDAGAIRRPVAARQVDRAHHLVRVVDVVVYDQVAVLAEVRELLDRLLEAA